MTTPYNLFSLGQQSKSSNLTAAHRLNLYYDVQAGPDKTQVAAYGTPGLNLFSVPTGVPTRGMHWMESVDTLFIVQGGSLIGVASNGTSQVIALSTVDLSGRVSMANNGTQLVIISDTNAYCYNTSTAQMSYIARWIYPNLVTNPLLYPAKSVTFLAGRFIVNRNDTGQFFMSALYDGTSWDPLDYATAESNPDNLVAVAADKGMLVLFGTSSVEIWSPYAAVAPAFPFIRVNAAPSDGGLAARWSLSNCAGYLTGLFKNRSGSLFIGQLQGYTLVPISTTDIVYIISSYTNPTDAIGFGYTLNGRNFYQITFISAGVTWLYDDSSKVWSQLKGWGLTRHRADMGAAFGTKYIVTDYLNGNLYQLSAQALTDNGDPIEREITGGHSFTDDRNLSSIRRLRVDMMGGVGNLTGQGINPSVMLQISRDGGHTFGQEMWKTIGTQGQYVQRAEWRRLGISRDWVFKIRITDPIPVCIIAAVVEGKELGC